METVLKLCFFTILFMSTKITAQEITSTSCFAPASVPVAGSASQHTVSRALLLFLLFIFFNYVSNTLLTNINVVEDPTDAFVDSEQNLFANNVTSNNPFFCEQSVPNQMSQLHHHDELSPDFSQIDSLTSSVLQEIESMGNVERNNLGTSADEERVEEVDDAAEKYSIDLNTFDLSGIEDVELLDYGCLNDQLNQPHVAKNEESVREYVNDLNTLLLSGSQGIQPMDHGKSHTEHNLEEVVGLDKHVVVNDLDTSSSSSSSEETEYERHVLPGETSKTDEVDKQMHHVNETFTVLDNYHNNCSGGVTLMDLQQQYGKKVNDAAESLGVSRSTFKRICRANGIPRWSCKRIVQQRATATATLSMATTSIFRSDNNMSIKASYNAEKVRFSLSLCSRKKDLEVEIEKRFGIQTGSYWIKYEDEDEDWILITCDDDLHHGMHTCMKRGITTMKIHVGNYNESLRM